MTSRLTNARLDAIRARAVQVVASGFRASLAAGARALSIIHNDLPVLLDEIDRLRDIVPAVECRCGFIVDVPVKIEVGEDGKTATANADMSPVWEHWGTEHMGLPSSGSLPTL